MNNRGFTLIEVMVASAIFVVVMGTIVTLSIGFADAAELQEIKITTTREAQRAFTVLTPLLRQASRQSINWGQLPGDSITFRIARDVNGNGFAVNQFGDIELGALITVRRGGAAGTTETTGGQFTMAQLVLSGGGDDGFVNPTPPPPSRLPTPPPPPRALATNLQQGIAPVGAPAGVVPDGVGFWVERQGAGLLVTIRTEKAARNGRVYTTTVREFIVPRNN